VSFRRNVTVSWEKCSTAMRIEGPLTAAHLCDAMFDLRGS
jgi:hypothetical protein